MPERDLAADYPEPWVRRGAHRIYARTTGPAGHGGLALARRWCCCTAFPTTCTSTTACSPGCARHGSRHLRLPRLGSFRKPADYPYTAANQTGDLDAVLDQLGLNRMVLVAHDASGPPAIDRALDHPHRIAGLVLLNTYYHWMPRQWPATTTSPPPTATTPATPPRPSPPSDSPRRYSKQASRD